MITVSLQVAHGKQLFEAMPALAIRGLRRQELLCNCLHYALRLGLALSLAAFTGAVIKAEPEWHSMLYYAITVIALTICDCIVKYFSNKNLASKRVRAAQQVRHTATSSFLQLLPPFLLQSFFHNLYLDTRNVEAKTTEWLVAAWEGFSTLKLFQGQGWYFARKKLLDSENVKLGTAA